MAALVSLDTLTESYGSIQTIREISLLCLASCSPWTSEVQIILWSWKEKRCLLFFLVNFQLTPLLGRCYALPLTSAIRVQLIGLAFLHQVKSNHLCCLFCDQQSLIRNSTILAHRHQLTFSCGFSVGQSIDVNSTMSLHLCWSLTRVADVTSHHPLFLHTLSCMIALACYWHLVFNSSAFYFVACGSVVDLRFKSWTGKTSKARLPHLFHTGNRCVVGFHNFPYWFRR